MKARTIMSCFIVTIALASCAHENRRRAKVESSAYISAIARKIESIPPGMKEGQIFAFLGIPYPDEPIESEIDSLSCMTANRYKIGTDDSYLLHCESKYIAPLERRFIDFNESELRYVTLLKRVAKRGDNYSPVGVAWERYR